MLDFKLLKKILVELENYDLFDVFLNNLLDYDMFKLEKCIVRYKINNGLIIDIFDYNYRYKFIRYNFSEKNDFIIEDLNVKVIWINLKENNLNNDKFNLFSLLFNEIDNKKIKYILYKLFDDRVVDVFKKVLKL